MKDYARYVVWLEYFNSELKRNQGRRVPLSAATKAPKIGELEEACRRLRLEPIAQKAVFPSSGSRESGYVSVKKEKPKQTLVAKVSKELSAVRGQGARRQPEPQSGQKK